MLAAGDQQHARRVKIGERRGVVVAAARSRVEPQTA
jgi:hypothetical protein